MRIIALLLFSYLLGGIPWGMILVRWLKKQDIRSIGSGNIGATNAFRAGGPIIGTATGVLDILKGAIPVYLGLRFFNPNIALLCGVLAVLGHTFTPYLKFRGGKGVATAVGAFFVLAPKPLLIGILTWVLTLVVFRYVSLASILGAIATSIAMPFMSHGILLSVLTWLVALVLIIRHKGNISRIIKKQEPKVWSKSK